MSVMRALLFGLALWTLPETSFAETPAAGPPTLSVLFVGNSLTQVNDLPGVLKQFAAASPLHAEITVRAITPGGAFFHDHWQKGEAVKILREQRPNILVLQGQSTEPLSAPDAFAYYGSLFKKEADVVGARTILLGTWARPATDPYYIDASSGGSPEKMQRRLNSAYAALAETLRIPLAAAGLAWVNTHRDRPDIELLDGSQHPSRAGTYLAAAVLFRTVFETSEVTSTYYGGLPKDMALSLQEIATSLPPTTTPK